VICLARVAATNSNFLSEVIDLYPIAAPVLRCLDAETAHRATILGLRWGAAGRDREMDSSILRTRVMGLDFPNPVGLAAGFDKHAEVPDALLALGFGFVEIGSVTPRPQSGNPRPRVFRLNADRAVINRYGFNSEGLAVVASRLRQRQGRPGIVGVNVGANKESGDPIADYVEGLERLQEFANYFVINVSSPNTPGLRSLQARDSLDALLDRLRANRSHGDDQVLPPLVVKIAPDLSSEECRAISDVIVNRGVDGIIVSNTTVHRPVLQSKHRDEVGGLSGMPLFETSTRVLSDMYRLTEGRIALIGTGGVSSGADAYRKIRAGASLVQLYTALVFEGPALIGRIKRDLASLLEADGFADVAQAVGVDAGNG
tara:strand:- start:632 stop:1747 length:1116 start_codon:yes stop_codon:yes gene_type:complete